MRRTVSAAGNHRRRLLRERGGEGVGHPHQSQLPRRVPGRRGLPLAADRPAAQPHPAAQDRRPAHRTVPRLPVHLGPSPLSPAAGPPLCGHHSEARLIATRSSQVLIVFHSDPSHQDRGFSLDYFAQSSAPDCQHLLAASNESGVLRSPGFPAEYPDNADCWTLVRAPRGQRIELIFEEVDLERGGDDCSFDYVRVFDGAKIADSSLLGRVCGARSAGLRLESRSESLLVHFHSDEAVGGRGYRAAFRALDRRTSPSGDCLWQRSESNGTVASPDHPSNYPSRANCSLWIVAPKGRQILMLFDALQLEMDKGCPFDFLQIEEEEPEAGGVRVLGRLCGNEGEPANLTSGRNEVHVVFQADDFAEFSGFKLRYFFVGEKKEKPRSGEKQRLSWVAAPRNATLELGSSHTMHCVTRPEGALLRWSKGGAPLAVGNPLPGLKLLANGTLWIQRMDRTLAGVYACAAQLGGDSLQAEAHVLVVEPRPDDDACGIVFRRSPSDASFAEGEFVHLECAASSGRGVRTSWEKDGRPPPPSRVTVLGGGHLFVDGARPEDAGVYTCVAREEEEGGCERRASALLQVTPRISVQEVCGRSKASEEPVPQTEHGKIIGGHDAPEGAHPWQAMLWEPSLRAFCGATLLNERWVATAAHCFVNYRNLRLERVVVRLGVRDTLEPEPGEFRTAIADLVVHPAYNRNTFDADLALARLRDHVTFSDRILPACLGDHASLVDGGSMGTVVGWGKLKEGGPAPRYLQEIRLPLVEQAVCRKSTNYTVTRNMFCAGYSQETLGDACHGDSGGPFLVTSAGRWHLVGVVSWGEGCGTPDKYGFYTRLPNYAAWIRGIVKS